MPDDSRTYLGVSGFGDDPAVVTDLIGLESTQANVKGDTYTLPDGRHISRQESAWQLESSLPQTAHVDNQIEALLDVIEPHADAVREAASRFEAGICCAIYYADFTPGIHLSEHVIQRISALGLSVDFDLYFLPQQGHAEKMNL